jgi:hypothetical protein
LPVGFKTLVSPGFRPSNLDWRNPAPIRAGTSNAKQTILGTALTTKLCATEMRFSSEIAAKYGRGKDSD